MIGLVTINTTLVFHDIGYMIWKTQWRKQFNAFFGMKYFVTDL